LPIKKIIVWRSNTRVLNKYEFCISPENNGCIVEKENPDSNRVAGDARPIHFYWFFIHGSKMHLIQKRAVGQSLN
jgi:hypothetical protein